MSPPPPCPAWCAYHEDSPAWPAGDDYRIHQSHEWIVHSPNPEGLELETFDVVVQMERMDSEGKVGHVQIVLGARHYGEGYEHPQAGSLDGTDRMSPAVALQLAGALLAMADAAEPAEQVQG